MVKKARASAQGLERVEERRRKLGWTKYDQQWREKAGVSESTLKRFWKPEEMTIDTFIKICKALEIDWKTITTESDRSDRFVVGETIYDRYKILELRTDKEHCKIYLAEDLHLDLSSLHLDLSDSPQVPKCLITQLSHHSSHKKQELLEREARTLHQLRQHTQIPQLYAYFQNDEKESYLMKEYIEGNPLEEQIIEGQPWSEAEVIHFLSEMLEILSFVQKRNVIHRNINPNHIIRRNSDKSLVLGHFSEISYYVDENYRDPSLLYLTRLQDSLLYIAPEQTFGLPMFSSDLYSLGKIAIQMLTGKKLSNIKIAYDTANIDWHNGIQNELKEFIDKIVEYNPKERYPSAESALKEFEQTFTK
ncbi:MAG: protein kinase [Crocosphaera sp.]